jgi:GNAT superfamily N-acetyltransferase
VDRREEGRLTTGPIADGEQPATIDVLARAFRDNPLNVAVIGGAPARRLRANRHSMRALLPVACERGEVWVRRDGPQVCAALIGVPPHAHPLPPPPFGLRLRTLLGQGMGTALRWARVFEELDRLHPPEPHWYLGTFGVDPARQGRGFGSGLLAAWLAWVDADGGDVYLETDRAENVSFYERAGFGTVRETGVLGVPVWCMRRESRIPG